MTNSVIQTIRDAEIDARSLSEFISKDASFTVARRLAPTIHTLDYYLLVLNRVKEKGDLADIAISDTLDKLEQLEPTVIQRVEDAINNTAVEGGVLADTFVVVDGTLSQRTINKGLESIADLLTIKKPKDGLRVYVKSYHAGLGKGGGYFTYDSSKAALNDGGLVINGWVREGKDNSLSLYHFGAKGDGVSNDTQALIKYIGVNTDTVIIPSGDFVVYTEDIKLPEKLHLKGTGGRILVKRGTTGRVFNITSAKELSVTEIEFIGDEGYTLVLLGTSDALLLNCDSLIVDSCTFRVRLRILDCSAINNNAGNGFFGFHKLKITNNFYPNSQVTVCRLSNIPVAFAEIAYNYITNMSYTFFYSGIGTSENNLATENSYFIHHNKVKNEDYYWSDHTSGSYYCLTLVEGESAIYEHNLVEGLKVDKENIAVYDAYLSCKNVISRFNIYKNNGNFNETNPNNWLIKGKADSYLASPTRKVWQSNTYIIEDRWLQAVGRPEGLKHKMYGTGVSNSGNCTIKDNVFKIHTLENSGYHAADYYEISGNSVYAKKSAGPIFSFSPIKHEQYANAEDHGGDIVVRNNTVKIEGNQSTFIKSDERDASAKYRSFTVEGNLYLCNLTDYTEFSDIPSATIYSAIKSNKIHIRNNTYEGSFLYYDFSNEAEYIYYENDLYRSIPVNETHKGLRVGFTSANKELFLSLKVYAILDVLQVRALKPADPLEVIQTSSRYLNLNSFVPKEGSVDLSATLTNQLNTDNKEEVLYFESESTELSTVLLEDISKPLIVHSKNNPTANPLGTLMLSGSTNYIGYSASQMFKQDAQLISMRAEVK